ncbi:hypothetical protein FRB94_004156 [Tulasnella sp. JGI-2019a]|nr:hypothetical protein FRB93_003540 [Tulasnella sp. JGI-2019a]KAG9002006.1 hypothetical protein FRB94_004156 [Tulasnella sp. JGI-2019a]KAG9037296.1 hypothetical protein FRB95_006239 [Tulasnella sp. JGI-2019a]
MLGRLLLSLAAVLIALGAAIYPTLNIFGILRAPISFNNEECVTISGMEACEDAWVDRRLGFGYLPCSNIHSRTVWTPALGRLNASALPSFSTDHITLLSLTAPYSHQRLKIVGLPDEARGLWVHGIEVWQDPSDPAALTLFLVSHRPPTDRASSQAVGADSVIEIFRTRAGDNELRWVRTVKHDLLKTPNSIAATGPTSFYVSNDHAHKFHWTRAINHYVTMRSEIIYCDVSGVGANCKVAVDGQIHPNGLVRGNNGLIYSAPTYRGGVVVFKRNKDHTLQLVDDIKSSYPVDNLRLDADTGDVYTAAFTKGHLFDAATTSEGVAAGNRSPVESWKVVQNNNGKHTISRAFADPGKKVSASTTAAPFGDKILFTGGQDASVTPAV